MSAELGAGCRSISTCFVHLQNPAVSGVNHCPIAPQSDMAMSLWILGDFLGGAELFLDFSVLRKQVYVLLWLIWVSLGMVCGQLGGPSARIELSLSAPAVPPGIQRCSPALCLRAWLCVGILEMAAGILSHSDMKALPSLAGVRPLRCSAVQPHPNLSSP